MLFSTVWSVTKGWLDPVTVAKIDILGSSYKEKLLQQIPADALPADLGGTCKCQPSCSLSDDGPWKRAPVAAAPPSCVIVLLPVHALISARSAAPVKTEGA